MSKRVLIFGLRHALQIEGIAVVDKSFERVAKAKRGVKEISVWLALDDTVTTSLKSNFPVETVGLDRDKWDTKGIKCSRQLCDYIILKLICDDESMFL